jgi:hypothetical protein
MSIKDKITPGPWEASVGNRGSIFGDLNNPIHNGDYPYIGNVAGIGVDQNIPECTANAKAIAAVPEMLDIIERLANASDTDPVKTLKGYAQDLLNELNTQTEKA